MKSLILLLAMTVPALAHDDCLPVRGENEVEGCDYTVDRAAELANALNYYAAGHKDGGEIARLVLGWGSQDDEREIEMRQQQKQQH